jgi:hypothetical protein
MSKIDTEIVIVKLPKPVNETCYLSHYTTLVHERRDGKILIDYPVGLNHRERKWIPEDHNVLPTST